jgi:hypothetical protein
MYIAYSLASWGEVKCRQIAASLPLGLSECSETDAWHRVLETLVRELTESDLLSFHTGNIAESRRLNIPRSAYYWYGGFVVKRVAMMLGCIDVYLWNEMMRPDSDVIFVGDAQNVVACYFICQQMCRLLKAVRLNNSPPTAGAKALLQRCFFQMP